MPELPDLIYLEKRLSPLLAGQRIVEIEIHEPIVIRMLLPGDFAAALRGAKFAGVRRHGPFLVFSFVDDRELVIHPMLAGRFQWTKPGERISAGCALSLECEALSENAARQDLRYLDVKKMGKVYLTGKGQYQQIPKFNAQGPNLLTPEFALEYFHQRLKKSRQQVRVLIMDQAAVSCIGNAYVDEILFCVGIHPKTFCHQLDEAQIARLHQCIIDVMRWGIDEVEKANLPLDVKARDFMRVRNRKGQPCPQCGAKIRRAGVRGFDTFFCPVCQPLQREQFIDWRKLS
jgi:formamidopyrimidine-DNA glycosylase